MKFELENIEISYKIIDYLDGVSSEREKQGVQDWINASQENKLFFEAVKSFWEGNPSLPMEKRQVEEHWKAFSSKAKISTNPKKTFFLYAAAIALLLVVSSALFINYKRKNMPLLLVAKDSITELYLPDSSFIVLNEGGNIWYKKLFGEKHREVSLAGEAYFKVQKDTSKPFIVYFGEHKAEVLGTSFVIRFLPNDAHKKVFVKEGSVRVSIKRNGRTETFHLAKGQKIEFDTEHNKLNTGEYKNENFLSWYNKNFSFENTPLSEVAKKLSEAFDTTIVNMSPTIDSLKLTADFQEQTLGLIIEVVSRTFGLDVDQQNDTILFRNEDIISQ